MAPTLAPIPSHIYPIMDVCARSLLLTYLVSLIKILKENEEILSECYSLTGLS